MSSSNRSTQLPERARALLDLGREYGWTVRETDVGDVRGDGEARLLSFSRYLPGGREFTFCVTFARTQRSGRWQTLKHKGKWPVLAVVLPGRATDTRAMVGQQLEGLYGMAVLEERFWPRVLDLEWWLARPDEVAAFKWAQPQEVPA